MDVSGCTSRWNGFANQFFAAVDDFQGRRKSRPLPETEDEQTQPDTERLVQELLSLALPSRNVAIKRKVHFFLLADEFHSVL